MSAAQLFLALDWSRNDDGALRIECRLYDFSEHSTLAEGMLQVASDGGEALRIDPNLGVTDWLAGGEIHLSVLRSAALHRTALAAPRPSRHADPHGTCGLSGSRDRPAPSAHSETPTARCKPDKGLPEMASHIPSPSLRPVPKSRSSRKCQWSIRPLSASLFPEGQRVPRVDRALPAGKIAA